MDGNDPRHLIEPSRGIVGGELLVLVLVTIRDLDLADTNRPAVPEHLEQRDDLEAPVRRQPHPSGKVALHRELSRQRVAERLEVGDVRMVPDEAGECRQQRCDEETREAAVQPVGHSGVVRLHEIEVEEPVQGR